MTIIGAQDAVTVFESARAAAARWVVAARARHRPQPLVQRLLEQLPLSSPAGLALMGLAEAMERVPDKLQREWLLLDKLQSLRASGDSSQVQGLARAAIAALKAAGRWLPPAHESLGEAGPSTVTDRLILPLLQWGVRIGVERFGRQFVFATTMTEALQRAQRSGESGSFSFDMLGEGARTRLDADRHLAAYATAIDALRGQPGGTVQQRAGISVKLSALEPRFSPFQSEQAAARLVERLTGLVRGAVDAGIMLTIDAEELERTSLTLRVLEQLALDHATREWPGLGIAIQAYSPGALQVIERVTRMARAGQRRMNVRLVKGAYWDTEIKRAQERGLERYPVFLVKAHTDLNYLQCARALFAAGDVLYPQFATHNALTVAAVLQLAPRGAAFEFQRLHGMGEPLYAAARAESEWLPRVRVYAPVGARAELLPYLVRRLLENGANSSFVHRFMDRHTPVEELMLNPANDKSASPLRLPRERHLPERLLAAGIDPGDSAQLDALRMAISAQGRPAIAAPVVSGRVLQRPIRRVLSPDGVTTVGECGDATADDIALAFEQAASAQPRWDAEPADRRAACLERAAELLEQRRDRLLHLLVREAGRTIPDALGEWREAIDFCRYYAAQGRRHFGTPQELHGPAGEYNALSLHGQGVFACISPWNFPLAIFTGQVTAALMAGNAVVAKPAPATPLIAFEVTQLLHEAGVPVDVLHFTPADGPAFGAAALSHARLGGVVFTGSTATASTIHRALAARDGAILPLIAETGGVNAMIVDSTALPEQVVDDVLLSAFNSAGQRCSALRLLCVQEEIADRVITMLVGAMRELVIGDPGELATDVGPMISAQARTQMQSYVARMQQETTLLHACALDARHAQGHYFAPHAFLLQSATQLRGEVFGPILHVVRYRREELPELLTTIRDGGFGLTMGLHSRVNAMVDHVRSAAPVGNLYVNRNMIGAVVGVQPFGGHGLSGTGPKAGGPHYLLRFASERTLTINTAAVGGTVELLG